MESNWYNFVLEIRSLFSKLDKPNHVKLCDMILEMFGNLESLGYCIILGENQDAFIDEVWNDLFNRFGGKNITFKIDKSKPKDLEYAKVALEKNTIKLLILNDV